MKYNLKSLIGNTAMPLYTTYHDTMQKGLYLMVYPSGVKVFWTRKMVKGRQRKIRIGEFPDISIDNARKKVADLRGKVAMGEDPTIKAKEFKKEKTFKELFDDFINKYAKHHKITWQEDIDDIEQYFTHWFNRKACSITKQEVVDFHVKLGAKYPFRANRMIQKLSSIFNKAIEIGWNHLNPAHKIQKFPEESRENNLDPTKLNDFIKSVQLEPSRTAKDFIMIALLTAVRKSNILQMKWSEISGLENDNNTTTP